MFTCMHVYHTCAVPVEARRGHQSSCSYSYRWLWATMLVLGTKPKSSVRTVSSPAPRLFSLSFLMSISNAEPWHGGQSATALHLGYWVIPRGDFAINQRLKILVFKKLHYLG